MKNSNKLETETETLKTNQWLVENTPVTAPIEEQLPGPEHTIKKLFSKRLYILIAISVLAVLLILAGIFFLYKRKFSVQISNTNPTLTTAPVGQQPYKAKTWYLKEQTKVGTEVIFTLPEAGGHQIVQWGDLLVYGSGAYSSNVQVFSYNFKTGEKKTIYDQSSRNDFESGWNNRYVSDMQVLNNTLFFSIGGYMTSGATFWMTLLPVGQPQKLTGGANGKIQYWKGKYWLMNGEGDACWSGTTYSLINLSTKKVTEIASSTSGCIEGEEFVDIDKRDRMILAFHTAGTGEGEDGNGIYQYVVAVPLNNPTTKEGIIAKHDMPADIVSVRYLENSDQLLLIGREKYLFDFSSKSITKTDMAVPTSAPSDLVQDKTFVDKMKELNLPSGYEFVLE